MNKITTLCHKPQMQIGYKCNIFTVIWDTRYCNVLFQCNVFYRWYNLNDFQMSISGQFYRICSGRLAMLSISHVARVCKPNWHISSQELIYIYYRLVHMVNFLYEMLMWMYTANMYLDTEILNIIIWLYRWNIQWYTHILHI